jgi:alginate production protein
MAAMLLPVEPPALAQDEEYTLRPTDLKVGQWVKVKGVYLGSGDMEADEIELLEPGDENELVGEVTRIITDKRRFWVLGHLVHTDPDTEWEGIELRDLPGTRVKVQGSYRSPRNFSGDQISPRGKGRDSIEGRIDDLRSTPRGLNVLIGNLRVLTDDETDVFSEVDPAQVGLAPLLHEPVPLDRREFRDEDDRIPGTIPIGPNLSFGALLEAEIRAEDEYDLDQTRINDRTDLGLRATIELRWDPDPDFGALFRGRASYLHRTEADEADLADEDREEARVSELWGYWARILGSDLDLQFGRQDFDEPREWIYDQNLDALRLIFRHPHFRAELSASTVLSDSSPRDENSTNLIAYLSNNDYDRLLAVYVIDRRDDRDPRDYPIHFGARAFGEWIPYNLSWAELSILRGYSGGVNLAGWGVDLGTTWSPPFLQPFNVTLGYAIGSGDDPDTETVDEGFRQTGFQDNNGTWGGVTSFRYYGELLDPELANLGILSAGVGWRFHRRGSIDLVYHHYRQMVAADRLRDTEVDLRPDGVHTDIGQELDLVVGIRRQGSVDLKFVLGYFEPGAAFPDADRAFLGSARLRFRF